MGPGARPDWAAVGGRGGWYFRTSMASCSYLNTPAPLQRRPLSISEPTTVSKTVSLLPQPGRSAFAEVWAQVKLDKITRDDPSPTLTIIFFPR